MKKVAIPILDGSYDNYIAALRAVHLEPHMIRPTDAYDQCDALLVPGGVDVAPSFYGESISGAENTRPDLDAHQLNVINAFIGAQKPVLGICRGHQLINVCLGGSLYQDLPTASRHRHTTSDQVHNTTAEKDSWLEKLYGSEHIPTNSSHHEGIKVLGKGLHIIQRADGDGVIEACVHESLPLITVQWHPERMCLAFARDDTVNGLDVFRYFAQMM